jgi:cation diffusion facilitator family transporter
VIGFLGNEVVALFRLKVGREIGSAALIADGYHARVDGWTSLAVLIGAVGVQLGYSVADPLAGLLITAAILWLVWHAGKPVFLRMIDGVEPGVVEALQHAAQHVPGVHAVTEVRARWLGHRLHAEVNIAVAPVLSVTQGHAIAKEVHHQLFHHVHALASITVHVDPGDEAGERYHHISEHVHDQLPAHSHAMTL